MKNAKASKTDKVKTPLSVYLIRPASADELGKALSGSTATPILGADGVDGTFYALPSEPGEPRWLAAVRTLLGLNANVGDITSQVAGGLFVLTLGGRVLAVSFGTGWLRLNDDWLELDFGRQVALNAIPQNKLIELKAEQVFAHRHVSSERAPVSSNRNAFGLDFDRDLLGMVEGVPENAKHLGASICGGVGLRLKIEIGTLFNALKESLGLYTSKAYQKHWPEVDNLTRVNDGTFILTLDGLLDTALGQPVSPSSPLLVNSGPRRDAEHAAEFFAIGDLPRTPKGGARGGSPYLMRGAWDILLSSRGEKAGLISAKGTAVHALDAGGVELYRTSIYSCLAFEASVPDATGIAKPYIFSQGSWYQTNANFVADVDAKLKLLAKQLPINRLLLWDAVEHEGAYNLRNVICDMVHFDAKNVHFGGGQSKFEFCDLMDPTTKTLYFVKIAVNSSHMSHLAEQIRRTAELFFAADHRFREALAKVVSKHHPKIDTSWVTNRPKHSEWNLCLVPLGRTLQALPFFAKCGVYRLAKELESRGHAFVCDER